MAENIQSMFWAKAFYQPFPSVTRLCPHWIQNADTALGHNLYCIGRTFALHMSHGQVIQPVESPDCGKLVHTNTGRMSTFSHKFLVEGNPLVYSVIILVY